MKPARWARLFAAAVAGILGAVTASRGRAEEVVRGEEPEVAKEETATSGEPSPFSLKYLMVPAVIGIARPMEMKVLNQALSAAEIPELPLHLPSVSLSIMAVLENGMILEPMYRMSIGASAQAVFINHHMLLNVGYTFIRRGEVMVYPWVGVGLGNAGLELTYAEPVGDAYLSSSAVVLHSGIGVNLWGSGRGDFLGLRTGVIWSPPDSGWKRRSVSVFGGPPAPLSQAYLAVALGFDTRPR
jgi:hypothetical protein